MQYVWVDDVTTRRRGSVEGEILGGLVMAGDRGMTRSEIRDLFGRHKSAAVIRRTLAGLLERGAVAVRKEPTAGRPREVWTYAAKADDIVRVRIGDTALSGSAEAMLKLSRSISVAAMAVKAANLERNLVARGVATTSMHREQQPSGRPGAEGYDPRLA